MAKSLFSFSQGSISFTQEGVDEFGPLFHCSPLVKTGDKFTKKTKLVCIEGMNMLACITSPISGTVEEIPEYNCPSELKPGVPILKLKENNAL